MKKNKSTKLIGIESICDFAEKQVSTLINWKRDFGFPMRKENNVPVSTEEEIIQWYHERNLTPKTANESSLEFYWQKQRREAGKKTFNKMLKGLQEIAGAVCLSTVTVNDWVKYYDKCPIKKAKDGSLYVDADDLYFWTKGMGFNCRYNFYNFGETYSG